MGSPLYMAPEQARGEDVDERADVWALTVVLYEAITGQPPFSGDDRAQVARAVAEASPPRFVLLEDGTVFVGGASDVASGRLQGNEVKEIQRQVDRVRKLPGLGSAIRFGPGATRYRLSVPKGVEIAATGDPGQAPAALKPLAALVQALSAFDHASLKPYKPTQFLLASHEAPIVGGCRRWGFAVPLAESVSGPRSVPADAAADWPTGAAAASVCSGNQTYVVTLRPLLPGEKP